MYARASRSSAGMKFISAALTYCTSACILYI
jgi:hypothetical protein